VSGLLLQERWAKIARKVSKRLMQGVPDQGYTFAAESDELPSLMRLLPWEEIQKISAERSNEA